MACAPSMQAVLASLRKTLIVSWPADSGLRATALDKYLRKAFPNSLKELQVLRCENTTDDARASLRCVFSDLEAALAARDALDNRAANISDGIRAVLRVRFDAHAWRDAFKEEAAELQAVNNIVELRLESDSGPGTLWPPRAAPRGGPGFSYPHNPSLKPDERKAAEEVVRKQLQAAIGPVESVIFHDAIGGSRAVCRFKETEDALIALHIAPALSVKKGRIAAAAIHKRPQSSPGLLPSPPAVHDGPAEGWRQPHPQQQPRPASWPCAGGFSPQGPASPHAAPAPPIKAEPDVPQEDAAVQRVLWVGAWEPRQRSVEDVRAACERYGQVVSVKMSTGRSGFAFVSFADAHVADRLVGRRAITFLDGIQYGVQLSRHHHPDLTRPPPSWLATRGGDAPPPWASPYAPCAPPAAEVEAPRRSRSHSRSPSPGQRRGGARGRSRSGSRSDSEGRDSPRSSRSRSPASREKRRRADGEAADPKRARREDRTPSPAPPEQPTARPLEVELPPAASPRARGPPSLPHSGPSSPAFAPAGLRPSSPSASALPSRAPPRAGSPPARPVSAARPPPASVSNPSAAARPRPASISIPPAAALPFQPPVSTPPAAARPPTPPCPAPLDRPGAASPPPYSPGSAASTPRGPLPVAGDGPADDVAATIAAAREQIARVTAEHKARRETAALRQRAEAAEQLAAEQRARAEAAERRAKAAEAEAETQRKRAEAAEATAGSAGEVEALKRRVASLEADARVSEAAFRQKLAEVEHGSRALQATIAEQMGTIAELSRQAEAALEAQRPGETSMAEKYEALKIKYFELQAWADHKLKAAGIDPEGP